MEAEVEGKSNSEAKDKERGMGESNGKTCWQGEKAGHRQPNRTSLQNSVPAVHAAHVGQLLSRTVGRAHIHIAAPDTRYAEHWRE